MGIGANSIGNGLTSGITGNINKAYILMHDPHFDPTQENGAGDKGKANLGNLTGLSAAAEKLQNTLTDSAASGRKLGVSGSALNAFSMDTDLMKTMNQEHYILVPVQFNPASISFQGMAGEIRRESVGGSGENQFQQFNTPSETTMAMELVFDDTNNKDAFMMDAELPLLSEIASVGGLAQRLEQGVTAMKGETYSVQDTAELFVAAMVQSFTRLVGFAWNKMIFWGELVGVNLKYTMFNKAGAPIRARVNIQIRQDQAIGKDAPYKTEQAWEKAFHNLFDEDKGNNAFGIKNSDSTNWLNGNFLNLS